MYTTEVTLAVSSLVSDKTKDVSPLTVRDQKGLTSTDYDTPLHIEAVGDVN